MVVVQLQNLNCGL